ncbi:MAG: hypothetical protein WBC65_15055, partial [Ignavibacteria bacterium]
MNIKNCKLSELKKIISLSEGKKGKGMKAKVLFFASLALLSWVLYTGFAPGDESPRWNPSPSTRINETPLTPADQYSQLPVGIDAGPVINEPQFINSPNGVYVVN